GRVPLSTGSWSDVAEHGATPEPGPVVTFGSRSAFLASAVEFAEHSAPAEPAQSHAAVHVLEFNPVSEVHERQAAAASQLSVAVLEPETNVATLDLQPSAAFEPEVSHAEPQPSIEFESELA